MATSATRPGASGGRVLVVLLGQTRAWELTAESLMSNVLDELGADLALCGGDRDDAPNPFYDRAKFNWRMAEPDDWGKLFDHDAGGPCWRVLMQPGGHLFGGIEDPEKPQQTTAALPLYFRKFLRESMERAGVTEAYDWLIVTRSDYLWPVPHPDPRYLSEGRIYALDGEEYGGVTDRHMLIPRRFVKRFLSVPDPIFSDPKGLKRRLDRRSAMQQWPFLNLERFLAARLIDLGLWRRVRFLPYVPVLVRPKEGFTGWSEGEFDEQLGLYVKYPTERERSQISQGFITDQDSWGRYLAPIRGAAARRRLKRAYRERGLYERPFARREMPVRAYRWIRWTLSDRLPEGPAPPIGRLLRKLPWMSALLDARLRRIRRRSVRREGS
jgi:hypothetical protein